MKQIFWCTLCGIMFFSCSLNDNYPKLPEQEFSAFRNQHIEDGRVAVLEPEFELDSARGVWKLTVYSTIDTLQTYTENWANQVPDLELKEFIVLPSKDVPSTWAFIQLSTANIRSQAKHSAELVTQAIMGTPVRVLQKKDDWYRIQTPDYYIGWVDPAALAFQTSSDFDEWQTGSRLIYMDFSGRAWEYPQPNAAAVCDLVMGAVLEATGQEKRGYKQVKLPDDRLGWVEAEKLEDLYKIVANVDSVRATDLEWVGRDLMGVPYLWGGTSSKGVDCSGFTKTIYWMNGWILPRDASQQVNVGMEVPVSDSLEALEAGDLIYFGRYRKDGSPKVTHVALHLGDRQILHSSGRVKVESLNPTDSLFNEYRYNSILSARRILGQGDQYHIQSIQNHPWYFQSIVLE